MGSLGPSLQEMRRGQAPWDPREKSWPQGTIPPPQHMSLQSLQLGVEENRDPRRPPFQLGDPVGFEHIHAPNPTPHLASTIDGVRAREKA